MVTIKAEWEMKTEFGTTKCEADKTIFANYRDVERVDEVVEWVKKLFNGKKYSTPCIDFLYDNNTVYGVTITRYFRDWNGTICKIIFDGRCDGDKYTLDKLTKAEIKEAYLHTVEMCMEYEKEVE